MNTPITMPLIGALFCIGLLTGCVATESHRIVETTTVESAGSHYDGPRADLVVGRFQNRSDYLQGLFSSGNDRLGSQAKTLLKSHLQQSNHFRLLDRENLQQLQAEAGRRGLEQDIAGARYAISGGVTEFGRKNTGDQALFGILGQGKTQTAYAKVTLSVIDVRTSAVVYSTQGAGEYALSSREVVGFGSTSGYDATLNGKVLNLAITEAVNQLVSDLDGGTLKLAP